MNHFEMVITRPLFRFLAIACGVLLFLTIVAGDCLMAATIDACAKSPNTCRDTRLTYECSRQFTTYMLYVGDNAHKYKTYIELAACYRSVDVGRFWIAALWAGVLLGRRILVYSVSVALAFFGALFFYAFCVESQRHVKKRNYSTFHSVHIVRDIEKQ